VIIRRISEESSSSDVCSDCVRLSSNLPTASKLSVWSSNGLLSGLTGVRLQSFVIFIGEYLRRERLVSSPTIESFNLAQHSSLDLGAANRPFPSRQCLFGIFSSIFRAEIIFCLLSESLGMATTTEMIQRIDKEKRTD